ncbi:hypothetical protein K8R33_01050 [archaeon]|nr:hypothetical protein [archaeon]
MIKLPIHNGPEKAYKGFVQESEKKFIERIKQLPNEELPHVEVGIRKLYFETYYLCALGFHNATIVMCGILCEALLKDLIYDKEKKEAHEIGEIGEKSATLGNVIIFCSDKKYIDPDEAGWFREIKNNIRDLYQHSNVKKIVKKTLGGEPVYLEKRIEGPTKIGAEEFLKRVKEVIGHFKPDGLVSGKNMRPLYDLEKGRIDEQRSLPLFLEVDKFLRVFAIKHFKQA